MVILGQRMLILQTQGTSHQPLKKKNLQYPPLWKLAILISAHLDVKTALTGYPGKPATADINTLM